MARRFSYYAPRLLGVVVSLGGLWLVSRKIDARALAEVLSHLRWGWLLAAILLYGLATLLAGLRWHCMLCLTRNHVHSGASVRLAVAGQFFNTLLLGPAGGDVAKAALYAHWYGQRMSEVMASCFLDRICGLAGLAICGGVALALLAREAQAVPWPELGLNLPAHWIIAGGVGVVLLVLGGWMHRRRFPQSLIHRTERTFIDGCRRLACRPSLALPALGLGFLVQFAGIAVFGFALQAAAPQPLAWSQLIWTLPLISVIGAFPVSIAGLGVRENAAFYLLGLYGVPGATAVAASLLTVLSQVVWGILGGAVLWHEQRRQRAVANRLPSTSISIVIPTLNEARELGATLERARANAGVLEIIVVDGGSVDETAAIARQFDCRVLTSSAARGSQLNAGVAAARGDIIVLLHADTWLPPDASDAIRRALSDRTAVAGGFLKGFRQRAWYTPGTRWRCALFNIVTGRLFGDQAIFARRTALASAGGVPPVALMEEFKLCARLRALGRVVLADATVLASNRRFARAGVCRTYGRMMRVLLLYSLGVPAERLRRIYEGRGDSP